MKAINKTEVQEMLDRFKGKEVYLHLETTNGAYASHFGNKGVNVGAYIRNAKLTYTEGKIEGTPESYRIGLKSELGWVYAEGLREWEIFEQKLLVAGHDAEGRLMVAFQLSETPFE
ncbi:YojF family protein [Pseudogracilibacillus sp. ICA-222130]|uniref:YojF family protein n=1 Tax=Pseudogracilibacillus sp. ICA-222130 TaxID=3134655 RepID=UPI0030BD64EC